MPTTTDKLHHSRNCQSSYTTHSALQRSTMQQSHGSHKIITNVVVEQVMAFLQGETDTQPVKAKQKPKGKAVVVGAGPAGLAAALHLQVNLHHDARLASMHDSI